MNKLKHYDYILLIHCTSLIKGEPQIGARKMYFNSKLQRATEIPSSANVTIADDAVPMFIQLALFYTPEV